MKQIIKIETDSRKLIIDAGLVDGKKNIFVRFSNSLGEVGVATIPLVKGD